MLINKVQNNPFDNLPKINKKEAISILKKPINKAKPSADYYKAVFHIAKFPCEETATVLLDFIKADCDQLEFRIAKRKAIEVLAHFDCKKAIPTIANFLKDDDFYLVETSIWSLGKLKCNDMDIINQICLLLYKQFNNKRVVIQTLTYLGVKKEIAKIRSFLKDKEATNAIKGASIAALIRLAGEEDRINDLKNFLRVSNQNDRHCAVQDIINSGQLSAIPFLIEAPISPSFKIQAIESLWGNDLICNANVDLIKSIDSVIIDDPHKINTLEIDKFEVGINFLIDQLFHTDFNRCYQSMKELKKYPLDEVLYNLNCNWDRAKLDYGAIYFFINTYKYVLENGVFDKSLSQKVDLLLSDQWPNYMKFKSSAIQVYAYLNEARFYSELIKFSDEKLTPFWKNRYTALLVAQKLKINISNDIIKLFLNDGNRFVRWKAMQTCSY